MKKLLSFIISLTLLSFTNFLVHAENENQDNILRDGLIGEYLYRYQDIDLDGNVLDSFTGKKVITVPNGTTTLKYSSLTNGLNGVNYNINPVYSLLGSKATSFWIYKTHKTFGVYYKNAVSNKTSLQLIFDNNKLRTRIFDDNGRITYDKYTSLPEGLLNEGKWNHIFLVDDKLYVNGTLFKEGLKMMENSIVFYSGNRKTNFKFYNRGLTQTEINMLVSEGSSLNIYNQVDLAKNAEAPTEGLFGYYKFEGNVNNEITESTVNIKDPYNYQYSYVDALDGQAFSNFGLNMTNINKRLKVVSFLLAEQGRFNFRINNQDLNVEYYPGKMGINDSTLENNFCDLQKGCYATIVFEDNKVNYYINGNKILQKNFNNADVTYLSTTLNFIDELRFYDENLPDSEIPKLINLYGEKPLNEIIINEGLNSKKQYEISATSKLGNVTGYSVTSGGVCDNSLAFLEYKGKLTFSNEEDNGKKVCFKAVNNELETFKMSGTISGVEKGLVGPTEKTTPIDGSDLFHDYKKWHNSDYSLAYDPYFIILDSSVNQDLYYAKTPVFNRFVDVNADGKIDLLRIERSNYNKTYVSEGINYFDTKIEKKYAILINEGNGSFNPEYRCVFEYSFNGRDQFESKYYGDCAK